jgi:ABC-2 type transport system ATP-binding protein
VSIVVNNISKYYGTQAALDDVSFSIGTNEIVGFLGPNGAGKSTMMKIITGYIPASSGRVLVDNMDITEDPVEIKKRIGYLPENNPLYPDMYILEYLQFIAGIYRIGKKAKSRIAEMIELTGLGPEQHKKIGQLSKGYRQRVGLAQALIHDPDILILDEPTSGLDPNQLVDIRKLISTAGKEKTVMLSTHIMQEIEAVADRLIIIDHGKIKADDRKADIYSHLEKEVSTIQVEFDSELEESALLAIEGAGRVRMVSDKQWLIEASVQDDIRPHIFKFAVDRGVTVLSMQKQESSLEELFRHITKDRGQKAKDQGK